MTEKILFVDDEDNILQGFKRQLRKQFTIATALGGEAGLAALRADGPFAVVVSDMRMPGMNGAQFLAAVRRQAPESTRIILSGQSDIDDTIAAINEGNLFRFLTKPCAPAFLVATLEAALEQHRLVTAERTLLEDTLQGCVKVMTDVLSLVNPAAFGRASRLKSYVRHIVAKLELSDSWQFELAAMLSQLGCVTLPGDVLDKLYAGQILSEEEQKMFGAHPAIGHDLLCHIPRLEIVAAMVAGQQGASMPPEVMQNRRTRDLAPLGAQILQIAIEYDQWITRGFSNAAAVTELLKHSDTYGIATALQGFDLEALERVVRAATVHDLCAGMTLEEDIVTKDGRLVIAKGHEVNAALVERLRRYATKVEILEPFRVRLPAPDEASSVA